MKRIGESPSTLAPVNSAARPTTLLLRRSLPVATGLTLAILLGQALKRYPNQTLEPMTQSMYLVEWEEMALRYGVQTLQHALLRAIRSARFFPPPEDILVHCRDIAKVKRDAQEAEAYEAAKRRSEPSGDYEREQVAKLQLLLDIKAPAIAQKPTFTALEVFQATEGADLGLQEPWTDAEQEMIDSTRRVRLDYAK